MWTDVLTSCVSSKAILAHFRNFFRLRTVIDQIKWLIRTIAMRPDNAANGLDVYQVEAFLRFGEDV